MLCHSHISSVSLNAVNAARNLRYFDLIFTIRETNTRLSEKTLFTLPLSSTSIPSFNVYLHLLNENEPKTIAKTTVAVPYPNRPITIHTSQLLLLFTSEISLILSITSFS